MKNTNDIHDTTKEENLKGIAAFSVSHPHLMIVICIIIVLLGVLGIARMPKDLLPASDQPAVQILSIYPGMATPNIETNLTWKFERYTGQAIGLTRQESRSMPGISIVKNFFDPASADQSSVMAQTTSLIMSVLRRLPPGAQPPIVLPFDPMAAVPLALVAVTGDFEPNTLYDYAQYDVRREVQSNPGAIAPTVMGGAEKQIVIELDPKKLSRFNLSPLEVIDKLGHLNTFIPTGDVKIGHFDYQVVSNGLATTMKDIDEFPLRTQEGVDLFLKQVGAAKTGNIIQTNVVTIDGKEQVYVPVFRQQGANSLGVVDTVRESIKSLQKEISGLKLSLVSDQTIYIRKAIESIAEEALIGGGLAALMVFLFLGNPRATFATLLSLPLSTFFVGMGLKATGQTINVMTLGGMALSIGLLVDNSIVAIENIMRHLKENPAAPYPERVKTVIRAAQEVMMPILASTLCNLIVLSPVILLGGVVKILFAAVAKTVMFAIVGSLIAETAVIPLFASHFLTGPVAQLPKFFRMINLGVHKVTRVYGNALKKVIVRFNLVIVFVSCMILLGIGLAGRIGTELFPKSDSGGMTLQVRYPSGQRIEETAEKVLQLEKKIREAIPQEDLHMIITNSGVYNGFPAAFTINAGPQDSFLIIELTEDRKKTSQYYAKILREKVPQWFPEVELGVQLGGLLSSALNGGLPSPIDMQVFGPDAKRSHEIAVSLLPQLKAIRGAVDVRIQERFNDPQINININRTVSDRLGLLTDEIVENVVSSLNGSVTFKPTIWVDPNNGIDYFMGVRFRQRDVDSFELLKEIPITGRNQKRPIPLAKIAEMNVTNTGITELNRVNMKRVINIFMDAQDRDIGGVSVDAQKIVNATKFPEGYHVEILGEISEMKNAMKSLGGGFALAALLVYLILVVQFRSFIYPGIMMMTVPMGMVGIAVMFVSTNTYFSLQAAIGMIFMIGIAVSNGVLLIEFIQHKMHHDHLPLDKAIHAGATARLRPIMMTSLASILGLTPMALGLSKGSEANVPLGRAVIGGQLVSTILTLFVLPTLFRFAQTHLDRRAQRVLAKRGLSLGVVLFACFLFPQISTAHTFSLDEVVTSSLKHHPRMKSVYLERQAEQQRVIEARSTFYPRLNAEALYSKGLPGSSAATGVQGLIGSPFRQGPSAGVVWNQVIWDFGRTQSAVDTALSRVAVSEVQIKTAKIPIIREAVDAYYSCALARSLLMLYGYLFKEAGIIEKEVAGFVRSSQRSMVDKYLAETQTTEFQTASADFQARYEIEIKRVAILTGIENAEESCPLIDGDLLLEEFSNSEIGKNRNQFTSTQSPVIEQATSLVNFSLTEAKRARAEYYPRIMGVASAGYIQDTWAGVPLSYWSASVGIVAPIFEGFRISAINQEASVRASATEQALSAAKLDLADANTKYDRGIVSAKVRIARLKTEIIVSEKAFKLAKTRYFDFQGSLLDLREALKSLARTQGEYRDALYQFLRGSTEKALLNGAAERLSSSG